MSDTGSGIDIVVMAWCKAHGTTPQKVLSRERVMGVACMKCGADRDEACVRRDGVTPRASNHMERVHAAIRAFCIEG